MNRKMQIVCLISLALSLGFIGGCVAKKDYLLKVEEGEKLSRELAASRVEYARLKGENDALKKEVARLKKDNIELEKILQSKADTLSQNVADLRAHVADLKKERSDLLNRISALERQREADVKDLQGTYDNLLKKMRSEIEKGKITITQLRGKLTVNMLDEILFDSGKTTIKPEGIEVLERVGMILLDVEDRAIAIEGHTDNVPIGPGLGKKYATNWELSAARATNVARYLQEKIGINPGLLSATGYGEYQPVASNETEEGRAKNRRIEIVLVPLEIAPVSRE